MSSNSSGDSSAGGHARPPAWPTRPALRPALGIILRRWGGCRRFRLRHKRRREHRFGRHCCRRRQFQLEGAPRPGVGAHCGRRGHASIDEPRFRRPALDNHGGHACFRNRNRHSRSRCCCLLNHTAVVQPGGALGLGQFPAEPGERGRRRGRIAACITSLSAPMMAGSRSGRSCNTCAMARAIASTVSGGQVSGGGLARGRGLDPPARICFAAAETATPPCSTAAIVNASPEARTTRASLTVRGLTASSAAASATVFSRGKFAS